MSYHPVAASELDFDAFVQAFNEAYENYFVPIHLTPANLSALIKRDAIDLASSVAMRDETGRVVGVAMLAIREARGWIGGVGVVEGHRRRGLARKMMEVLINNSRKKRLSSIELEVITQNIKAFELYKDLGFEIQRRLLVLQRPALDVHVPPGFVVRECLPLEALRYFESFHDAPNAWQRSLPALQTFAHTYLEGWTIAYQDAPTQIVGYAVAWPNEDHIQWMDIGIAPHTGEQATIGQTLLASLHRELPDATGSIINVGEHDAVLASFLALGYTESMAQYEMVLKLE